MRSVQQHLPELSVEVRAARSGFSYELAERSVLDRAVEGLSHPIGRITVVSFGQVIASSRIGALRFGRCRNCGDPVKRRGGRLCSSCWWAVEHKGKRQAKNEGELPSGSGAVS